MSKLLKIEIVRNSDLKIKLKIAPEIENFFKGLSSDIMKSDTWKNSEGEGLQYYNLNTRDLSYKNKDVYNFLYSGYSNNIGESLYNGDYVNTAIFRIVGASNSKGIIIKLANNYSEDTLKLIVEEYKKFIAKLYKKFITPVTIKCELKIKGVL